MKSRLQQVAFAAFFTLLGMAIAIMGVVAFDSKSTPATANNATSNQKDARQSCVTTNTDNINTAPTISHSTAKASTTVTPNHTMQTDSTHDVIQLRKGPGILVHDIINPNRPGIEFVPFYNAQGEFDKVAVYRLEQGARSTSFEKRMDMIYPLSQASKTFPPISEAEAQQKAQRFKPNSYPQYQGRLVTFANVDIPYYYFKLPNEQGTLLVDALTGMAQTVTNKDLEDEKSFQEMQEDGMDKVMQVDASGQFYTSPDVLKKLPEKERNIIKAEQTFFNKMIARGLLKVNKNGEFIEDNMTDAHRAEFDDMMEKLLGPIGAGDIR